MLLLSCPSLCRRLQITLPGISCFHWLLQIEKKSGSEIWPKQDVPYSPGGQDSFLICSTVVLQSLPCSSSVCCVHSKRLCCRGSNGPTRPLRTVSSSQLLILSLHSMGKTFRLCKFRFGDSVSHFLILVSEPAFSCGLDVAVVRKLYFFSPERQRTFSVCMCLCVWMFIYINIHIK